MREASRGGSFCLVCRYYARKRGENHLIITAAAAKSTKKGLQDGHSNKQKSKEREREGNNEALGCSTRKKRAHETATALYQKRLPVRSPPDIRKHCKFSLTQTKMGKMKEKYNADRSGLITKKRA
jgi:hypothetical protein